MQMYVELTMACFIIFFSHLYVHCHIQNTFFVHYTDAYKNAHKHCKHHSSDIYLAVVYFQKIQLCKTKINSGNKSCD